MYDAMNKIHSSNTIASSQVKEEKQEKKEILTPISHSYTCDYILTWDHHGKMVVKYIGAHTKKEIIKGVCGCLKLLSLTFKDPNLFGYLKLELKFVL